jgi:hypothetical protein
MSARVPASVIFIGILVAGRGTAAPPVPRTPPVLVTQTQSPQYVVYYWRARPGKLDAYNEYIKTIAEPIDESARNAGVFEEVHTYLSSASDASRGDWTHVRVFKLGSGGTAESLSAGLDSATKRLQPDEGARARNTARAAELRDFVKRETWTELK